MPTEFEFISHLKSKFNLSRIGDDCAILPKDEKTDLVITSDLLVEDIDFRLKWTTPAFIGHKALAVSLSDVAAMGAKPVWSLVSIGVPPNIWKTDFVDEFYEGYVGLAKKFEVELIGGDISKTTDKIVVDSTVAGEVEANSAVMRSGAKIGDAIFVTGPLGGAAAGLKLLESGVIYKDSLKRQQKSLLLKQLQPFPQISAGQILNNIANSMIDLSDGLSSDLSHICRSSRVGAKIYAEKIPGFENVERVFADPDEKINSILHGGEDFELLFTADQKKISELIKLNFYEIGEITPNVDIIDLISDNKSKILTPQGFQHF